MRTLKPSFFSNEVLGQLSPLHRLLFAGLWVLADREGRLEDRPSRIKAEILPYDTCDVSQMLTDLATAKFITRYAVNGTACVLVDAFSKHQRPHLREAKSVLPAPKAASRSRTQDRVTPSLRQVRARPEAGLDIAQDRPEPNLGSVEQEHRTTTTGNRDYNYREQGQEVGEKQEEKLGSAGAARPAARVTCADTWAAYREAYQGRYRTAPVRNAKVNGQLVRLVQRLGRVEAPQVAAFYLGHNGTLYVRAKHCVDLLLRDAEGLRTEWATGRMVTETEARETDRRQGTGDRYRRLIETAEHEEVPG